MVTRRDLGSPGYQGVQAAHAFREFIEEHPEIDKAWYKQSNYLALLAVNNEQELVELLEKAKTRNISCSFFREPDLGNAITAIALEPGNKSKKLCRDIKLV